MSIGLVYLCYLLISLGLTFVTGHALTRNGRLFLLDGRSGHDGAAEGLSNLLVVAFYLLALGFVALTMRAAGDVATGREAMQLIAAKVGYVLLVLGALYLASIAMLTRLRRRTRLASGTGGPPGSPAARAPAAGRAERRPVTATSVDSDPPEPLRAGTAGPGQVRPAGPQAGGPTGLTAHAMTGLTAERTRQAAAGRTGLAAAGRAGLSADAGTGLTADGQAGLSADAETGLTAYGRSADGRAGLPGDGGEMGLRAAPGRLGPGQPLWRPRRRVG